VRRRLGERDADAIGVERAGLDRVDGDVVLGVSARAGGDESGEAGARARRGVETGERRAHRRRRDVDDAAEASRRHARQSALGQRDRRQHVGLEPGEDHLARQIGECGRRRPAVVVDENVGLETGGEERVADGRIVQVAGDGDHLGAGRDADFLRRFRQPRRVAAVDRHHATRLGQRVRAGLAEPAARCADDRLAARQPQIHCPTPSGASAFAASAVFWGKSARETSGTVLRVAGLRAIALTIA